MIKKELRKTYLEKRKALSPQELARISIQVKDSLFSTFDFTRINSVHCYLPIKKFNEINTFPIIQAILDSGIKVAVSRSNFSNIEMENFWYEPHIKLSVNRWGIPEPENGVEAKPPFGMLIIPLVIFDRAGHRVGYGKGFYDRFLEKNGKAIKVGLSCFEPIELIHDISENDVTLDYFITPGKVFDFTS